MHFTFDRGILDPKGLVEALISITPTDEYFLDYLVVTQDQEDAQVIDEEDDVSRDIYLHDQAVAAVEEARTNFHRLDVPFDPPSDFISEMLKPPHVMARVHKRRDALDERRKQAEQSRRRREYLKHSKSAADSKQRDIHASRRQEREIISRWKDARSTASKAGKAEEALPSLEEVTQQYIKERKARRRSKNQKYGGGKGGRQRYRKNNTSSSSKSMSAYKNRQFMAKKK
eukprot:gnl/Dysnectes_brevis/2155_a2507_2412.p2 GENE.gnl/Dysnectes_brevis/2155_a2507_2412~~gnl/Dysnectes_brevis/2155_a2507_2412.p2  ORF type:complete len:229 (-),score=67.32 gnl/Dysnectes_brevis/2155_a2507_2412:87-773(-)